MRQYKPIDIQKSNVKIEGELNPTFCIEAFDECAKECREDIKRIRREVKDPKRLWEGMQKALNELLGCATYYISKTKRLENVIIHISNEVSHILQEILIPDNRR